jgi:hypothetical protein
MMAAWGHLHKSLLLDCLAIAAHAMCLLSCKNPVSCNQSAAAVVAAAA